MNCGKNSEETIGRIATGRLFQLETSGEKPNQGIRKKKPLTISRSKFFSEVQNDYYFNPRRDNTHHT